MSDVDTPVGANLWNVRSQPLLISPKPPTAIPAIVRSASDERAPYEGSQNLRRSSPSPPCRAASRQGVRSAGIRADLFPYRSCLSKRQRVPLGSQSFQV